MSDELKPCPFCGCHVQYEEDWDAITCAHAKDGCGFTYNCDLDLTAATKQWNTRATERESDALRRELQCSISQDDLLFHLSKKGYEVTGIDGDESPAEIVSAWVHGEISEAKDQLAAAQKEIEELRNVVMRMKCGCLSKDCRLHGSHYPALLDAYDSAIAQAKGVE